MYFGNFSSVWYDLEDTQKYTLATNVLQRVAFRQRLKNEGDFFVEYNLKDTDRPEIIADKIYGDPNFHWVVLLFNEKINPMHEWVKSDQELYDYFQMTYKGTVLFLNSSDFKIKTGDIVGINRVDNDGAWRLISTKECISTDKSLHKIILDGEVDYEIGDGISLYASIDNPEHGLDEDPQYTYRTSSGEQQMEGFVGTGGYSKNDPAWLSSQTKEDIFEDLHNTQSGTTGILPDGGGPCPGVGGRCGWCVKNYKLRVTITTTPSEGQTTSCKYFVNAEEESFCQETAKGPPPEFIDVNDFEEINNEDGSNVIYFVIAARIIGGRCSCNLSRNSISKQHRGEMVFTTPWIGATPSGVAESFFSQLVSKINPSIELLPCCSTSTNTSHFNFEKPSIESNEHRWFGVDSSLFVDSLTAAYRGKLAKMTVVTDISYGRQQYQRSLYDGDGVDSNTQLPIPILKIVLLPEKSLHHFENASGFIMNPFGDENGVIFSGVVANPTPLPWIQTLLYKYTQNNQLIDGTLLKAVSMEEFEIAENEKKRPIKLLRPEFLDIAVKEIEELLED